MRLGVQTQNIINDSNPSEGFAMMAKAGFACADFSLNSYLINSSIYRGELNDFFNRTVRELEEFFLPHKRAAGEAGVAIHQMHMPYPMYVPGGKAELNDYLWNQVAPKSMELCHFFGCPYIVVHGFKLVHYLGSEEKEWEQTEKFIHSIAPMAKEMGITICIENLYDGLGGHLIEGPCCDGKKVVERIDRINERYGTEVLGFCFDTGHANLAGINFERFIGMLGHRLKVLHIHDNDGIADLHQIPFTFSRSRGNKTSTDWEGFVRGLGKIGFDKVLSFETAPVLDAFPEEMKRDAIGFIARIGGYFVERGKIIFETGMDTKVYAFCQENR